MGKAKEEFERLKYDKQIAAIVELDVKTELMSILHVHDNCHDAMAAVLAWLTGKNEEHIKQGRIEYE